MISVVGAHSHADMFGMIANIRLGLVQISSFMRWSKQRHECHTRFRLRRHGSERQLRYRQTSLKKRDDRNGSKAVKSAFEGKPTSARRSSAADELI